VDCDNTSPSILSTHSLHDALPISSSGLMDEEVVLRRLQAFRDRLPGLIAVPRLDVVTRIARVPGESRVPEPVNAVAVGTDFVSLDRKSTRLNSSHRTNSYAVLGLK